MSAIDNKVRTLLLMRIVVLHFSSCAPQNAYSIKGESRKIPGYRDWRTNPPRDLKR